MYRTSTTYTEDQSQTDNDVEYSITNLPYPRQMSSLEKYCHPLLRLINHGVTVSGDTAVVEFSGFR